MVCEKCGKEFFEEWRKDKRNIKKNPLRFCSRECANSRVFSEESKRKKSIAQKKWIGENKEKHRSIWKEARKIRKETIIRHAKKSNEVFKLKIEKSLLETPFEELGFDRIRKRVILEQDSKCNRCKLDTWLGEKITFELNHINGDNSDNRRENLETLCPNCHSLTGTWRGRNKKYRRNIIKDETLVEAFLETGNIRQCLLKIGLAAKGNNYGRVKRALTLRGIKY